MVTLIGVGMDNRVQRIVLKKRRREIRQDDSMSVTIRHLFSFLFTV